MSESNEPARVPPTPTPLTPMAKVAIFLVFAAFLFGVTEMGHGLDHAVGFGQKAMVYAVPLGLGAICTVWLFSGSSKEYARNRNAARTLDGQVFGVFVGLFLGIVLYGAGEAVIFLVRQALNWISALPAHAAKPVGTAVTLVAAGLLFAFRCHARAAWGFSEIMVSLYGAWKLMPTKDAAGWNIPESFQVTAIAASLYLAVRGMDNIQQGHAQDKLLAWLRTAPWRKRKS